MGMTIDTWDELAEAIAEREAAKDLLAQLEQIDDWDLAARVIAQVLREDEP